MSVEFETRIEEGPRGGAFVEIPEDVHEELGGGGRIAVRATFDGMPYQGSVVRMDGKMILGVLKAIREALVKGPGDLVDVAIEVDRDERSVVVPAELEKALSASPAARDTFESLSFSHRREYANWISEAKKPETRDRRAGAAVKMLKAGKTL